jgi:TolB-like protein
MQLAILALVLAIVPPSSAGPKKVAVMDLRVDGGADPVVGAQLTARLAEVIGRRPSMNVIAPDDLRALLEQESRKQLAGCTEESCLTEIAGALGVDALVSGRVSKVDKGFVVSLSLIDAKEAHALGHVSETWGGESIGLLDLVSPMVDQLFAAGEKLVGSLEIEGAESGSRILIDDQVRGTAPAGQMADIPIGSRHLQVLSDDTQPVDRWVVVKKGERTTVAVEQRALESHPFYSRWWFWTIAGVAVAGTVVGAAVLTGGGSNNPGGETGVSVSANADNAFSGGR